MPARQGVPGTIAPCFEGAGDTARTSPRFLWGGAVPQAGRRTAIALLVAGALLLVGGCGDGDDATQGEATGQGAATSERQGPSERQGGEGSKATLPDRGGEGSGTGEGSRGGEKSIEEFGEEAGETEREAILAVFGGYLTAVAADDAVTACSHLSATVHESLKQLVARGEKNVKCAQVLAALLAPTAATIAREQADGEVTRVRVEGDRAFVVFRAPGAKLYMLGLVEEGGKWKATTVAASVLVPDL